MAPREGAFPAKPRRAGCGIPTPLEPPRGFSSQPAAPRSLTRAKKPEASAARWPRAARAAPARQMVQGLLSPRRPVATSFLSNKRPCLPACFSCQAIVFTFTTSLRHFSIVKASNPKRVQEMTLILQPAPGTGLEFHIPASHKDRFPLHHPAMSSWTRSHGTGRTRSRTTELSGRGWWDVAPLPAPQTQATAAGTRSRDAQPGHGCSVPTPARSSRAWRSGATTPGTRPGNIEER